MKCKVLSFFLVLLPVSCSYALNIAVIADKTGGLDKSPLLSLLEVQLSNNKNIKLVERTQIDKILQEQQLSAAGLLERNNAIKVGHLLRADAFIILSLEKQMEKVGDLIRVRLAETAHGLRLLDYFEQTEASKPDEVAQKITKRIESVMAKLTLPAGTAVPVGIVDIHRVQLDDKYRILERALPALFSVRLGIEPKIIMLEREDFKILQDEKLRTSGEDSKFWGSGVLIEGNLQPKNGGLEMSLSLRRVGEGTKNFTVPVDPNEPSVAVDKAAKEIVQDILNAPPTSQWQLSAEAERFYQEGQMFTNHQRYEEAFPLFETAYALQPENVYYTGVFFSGVLKIRNQIEIIIRTNESKIRRREEEQKKNPQKKFEPLKLEQPGVCSYSDIEIAEMASILVRQIRDGYEKGLFSAREMYKNWADSLGGGLVGGYFKSNLSASTEQIRLINRENRKIWFDTFEDALQKQTIRGDSPSFNNIVKAGLASIRSDDPNERKADIKKAFYEYVMPPELGGKIRSASERQQIYRNVFFNSLSFLTTEEIKKLVDVNDSLISTISKQVLLQEYVNSIKSQIKSEQSTSTQTGSVLNKTIEFFLDELRNFDPAQGIEAKKQLISIIVNLITGGEPVPSSALPPGSGGPGFPLILPVFEEVAFWEEICNILLEQQDIDSLVFLNPGKRNIWLSLLNKSPMNDKKQELYIRYYVLLESVHSALKSHADEKSVVDVLNDVMEGQARLGDRISELRPTQETKFSVNMLIATKDWLIPPSFSDSQIGPLVVTDNMFWICLSNFFGEFNLVGLVGIDLAKRQLTSLWETIIPNGVGTGISINPDAIYLFGGGILEFPGSSKEGREFFLDANEMQKYGLMPREYLDMMNKRGYKQQSIRKLKVYTQKNGLPSISFKSVAQEGDKFWIAYGDYYQESGLGLYDPKTEKWETVFCSTLKDNPPFSAGQTYRISSMIFVKPNTLFLRAGIVSQSSGLWKMDTNTRHIQKITSVREELTEDPAINSWLTGKGLSANSLREDRFLPESFFNKVKFGSYYTPGNFDLSTGTVHNNKLWARLGRNQILVVEKGKNIEDAKIIDNNILDGEPVWKFISTQYGLIAIGNGTVGLIETK